MASVGAVLDACVLFPAALRDALLRAGAAGLYRPYWTDELLDEVRRNLVDHHRTTAEQARQLTDTMTEYFPECRVSDYTAFVKDATNHPKDRHVVGAALKAGARVIVTLNLRDFPSTAIDRHGIAAQSPDTFLMSLFENDSSQLVAIVAQQAADLRNPMSSVADVLAALAANAPAFAAAVGKALLPAPVPPCPT